MRLVIQRVSEASVTIDNQVKGKIGTGLLVLIGIEHEDTLEDAKWLVPKMLNMRIFGDEEGKMNRSLVDVNGEILLISQFTLHASTKKGNRPGFTAAARPELAVELYAKFVALTEVELERRIQTGTFGADMKVSLINDGPVTIIMDSKNRE